MIYYVSCASWHVAAIQDLLNNANPDSPANTKAYEMYVKRRSKYNEEIRKQALKYIDDI